MIREIRERNENDSWRSARHNRPPDRAAVPLFLPLSVNRVKRGAPLSPRSHCSHSQGEERRVNGEAFRSRAFAFAPGWRTVKNKDPFVRIGVEREREREEDCDLFRKRRSVERGEVFRREGKGVVVQRA